MIFFACIECFGYIEDMKKEPAESASNSLKIILSTHDDLLQAQDLARLLVESRAAACVNLVQGVTSVFSWENTVQLESEILLIVKTSDEKVSEVKALLEEQHTYEVPEIIELDGAVLHQPYMEWLHEYLD